MFRHDSEHLIQIYKVAVEEYRFEVTLGWDRMKYYLVLNSAIVSIGTGLLQLQVAWFFFILVAGVFAIGLAASFVGLRAIGKAHEYYRRAVFKKTLIEDVLGLGAKLKGYPHYNATLAIGTTEGQTSRYDILHDTDNWLGRPLRRTSVVYSVALMLKFMAAVNIVGIAMAVWLSVDRFGRTLYIPWP
ncbi:MAG: hypothetical protein WD733_06805 [Bryobacterales bacterium]